MTIEPQDRSQKTLLVSLAGNGVLGLIILILVASQIGLFSRVKRLEKGMTGTQADVEYLNSKWKICDANNS